MRRITVAVACLSILASAGARAGADNGGASTSLVLSRTHFLSTEKVVATLEIANNTTRTISFPSYNIVFFVRAGSRWQEQSWLKTIAHMPSPTLIAPLSRLTMALDLPSCAVYSDPCSEQVIVRYAISIDGTNRIYQTALPLYQFFPDPSATYDVPGLKGDRPVFIAPGLAHDTVFPDTLRIEFTASPSADHPPFSSTPALVGELAQALDKAGVPTGSVGFDTDGATWKAYVYVSNASSQQEKIAAALARVRERFRSQISAIGQQLVFQPFAEADGVSDQARAKARQLALVLAESIGLGDIAPALFSKPLIYLGDQGSNAGIPALTHASSYDSVIVLQQKNNIPTPISVLVDGLFVGSGPAGLNENSTIATSAWSAFQPPDGWSSPPLGLQPVIAADRPEIYVTGTVSVKAALNRGVAPYLAAVLAAQPATRSLAQMLGAKLGRESLFAAYRLDNPNSDLRTLGVATTFSGGDLGNWQRIRPDSSIRVSRGVVDPRQRTTIPIAVPEEETTISESARAFTTLSVVQAAQSQGKPQVSNCSKIEEDLVRATIRQNWIQALSDARSSHRQLRKLLLVAVLPGEDQNFTCVPAAHGGQRFQGALGQYPGQGPLMFRSSLMIFRTFPKRNIARSKN